MSKQTITIGGQKVVLDMNRPKVAELTAALIQECVERHFPIGMALEHQNGDEYLLAQIKQASGKFRAYLINEGTGRARNSRKVVYVQNPGEGTGYVTDLPAERDKFYDPEANDDSFIDC